MKVSFRYWLCAVLVGLAGSVVCAGIIDEPENLIVNGSFESPDIADGTWQSYIRAVDGWKLVNGSTSQGFEIWDSLFSWESDTGDQHLELDDDIIQQAISTKLGQKYQLSFAFAPRPTVPDNEFFIEWNGEEIFRFSGSGAGDTKIEWRHETLEVVATSDTSILRLTAIVYNPDFGSMIDSFQLFEVPEPASFALVGLVMMPLFARRR